MTLLDQIKSDRDAGTPGPWFSMPMQGPRTQTNFARVFATDDDLRYIADFRDTLNFHSKTDNETNARRCARVPDMEAALIAAGELADTDAVEQMISDVFSEGGGVREAAAYISSAFRRAIGAK